MKAFNYRRPSPTAQPTKAVAVAPCSPSDTEADHRGSHAKQLRALPADKDVELRATPRFFHATGIIAIPVLPGGRPDANHVLIGSTVDVGRGGLAFEVPRHMQAGARRLVIGVEAKNGSLSYAVADVRHRTPTTTGLRVGVAICEGDDDLLRPENLMPTLNLATLQFQTLMAEDLLQDWGALGVMRPRLIDYAQMCPQCHSLPSFRKGCRQCGSARVGTSQLIHHFACAHVGHVPEFERNGELVCPKCRARALISGSDFEYLSGPFSCQDCQWTDSELEQIGQCLVCGLRFPHCQALEVELVGYHVERLDPLALLGPS